MKEWKNPEIWILGTENTLATTSGTEEDHTYLGDGVFGSKAS